MLNQLLTKGKILIFEIIKENIKPKLVTIKKIPLSYTIGQQMTLVSEFLEYFTCQTKIIY